MRVATVQSPQISWNCDKITCGRILFSRDPFRQSRRGDLFSFPERSKRRFSTLFYSNKQRNMCCYYDEGHLPISQILLTEQPHHITPLARLLHPFPPSPRNNLIKKINEITTPPQYTNIQYNTTDYSACNWRLTPHQPTLPRYL
jgi:hypothetical protein